MIPTFALGELDVVESLWQHVQRMILIIAFAQVYPALETARQLFAMHLHQDGQETVLVVVVGFVVILAPETSHRVALTAANVVLVEELGDGNRHGGDRLGVLLLQVAFRSKVVQDPRRGLLARAQCKVLHLRHLLVRFEVGGHILVVRIEHGVRECCLSCFRDVSQLQIKINTINTPIISPECCTIEPLPQGSCAVGTHTYTHRRTQLHGHNGIYNPNRNCVFICNFLPN